MAQTEPPIYTLYESPEKLGDAPPAILPGVFFYEKGPGINPGPVCLNKLSKNMKVSIIYNFYPNIKA